VSNTGNGVFVSAVVNRLILSGFEIVGETAGVRCANLGRLWLDASIVQDAAIGINANTDCDLTVTRSVIRHNTELGIEAADLAGFRLENSAVIYNGTVDTTDSRGVSLSGVPNWSILYSTIVGNLGDDTVAGLDLLCGAESTGVARNSIIMGHGDAVDCPAGLFDFSVTNTEGLAGRGSVVSPFSLTYFVNVVEGDHHLNTNADLPFADVAQWVTGHPFADLDGDPRPLVEGARDWPGADVP
jgi:hypothetical protein